MQWHFVVRHYFDPDSQWQLLAINQMALSTRYFTQYSLYPTVSIVSSGTINKNVTIQPYLPSNVYFINNSQNKIVRKGYPKLLLEHSYTFPSNYIHNGTFKGVNPTPNPDNSDILYGWYIYRSAGPFPAGNINIIPDSNFNTIELITPATGINRQTSIQNTPPPPLSPYLYAPYMTGPNFTFSLEHRLYISSIKAKLQITILYAGTTYYYNSSNTWQTTQTNLVIEQSSTEYVYNWTTYSLNVSMTTPAIPIGIGTSWAGQVIVKVYVDDTPFFNTILMRNLKITQGSGNVNSLEVSRQVGSSNTPTKDLQQPYGTYYLFPFTVNPIYGNNLGVLYNNSGSVLKNWYRYPRTESFTQLQMLVARQFSNLLNKNFATLEADLGKFKTELGLNYLDKVYSLTDSVTNALSYNGLKFLMNRGAITPFNDEVSSFQIIEITDEDNASTETVKYIDQ